MKKIENPENNKYKYNPEPEEQKRNLDDYNDIPDETESENSEPIEENYKVVDEKAKLKMFIAIALAIAFVVIVLLLNFGITRTQKSKEATDVSAETSVSDTVNADTSDTNVHTVNDGSTEDNSNSSNETSNNSVSSDNTSSNSGTGGSKSTTKRSTNNNTTETTTKMAASEYTIFGTWKIDDTNSELILAKNNGKFQYVTKSDNDKITYTGSVKIYVGSKAASYADLNMQEVYKIFRSDANSFNENNLFFVDCSEEKYQKNNEPAVSIDDSENLEGTSLFKHLVYVYTDSDGKTVAKYYDETSVLGLFGMTLVK